MTLAVLNGRLQLVLLALLFGAPLVLAWVLYLVPTLQPSGRTNYGTLMQPVQTLPALDWRNAEGEARARDALEGRWSLVYPLVGDCDAACETQLAAYRQSRLLLNEKRQRVQIVLLADAPAALPALRAQLAEAHPQLRYLAPAQPQDPAAAVFAGAPAGTVFVVDPLGNVMMWFPPEADQYHVLRDIKRLLRLSRIG